MNCESLKEEYSNHFIIFFVPFSLACQINVFHGTQFGKNLVKNMEQFEKSCMLRNTDEYTNMYTYKQDKGRELHTD